jgi:hypothetical protein
MQTHALPVRFLLGLALLAGCSRNPGVPRGTAEGKITAKGAPVTDGTVIFENTAAGVSAMIPLKSDGSYVLSTYEGAGLPVGTYQVAVSPRKISNGEFPKVVEPSKQAPPPFPVPEKFRSIETSGWTAVIKEGKNDPFNFDAR